MHYFSAIIMTLTIALLASWKQFFNYLGFYLVVFGFYLVVFGLSALHARIMTTNIILIEIMNIKMLITMEDDDEVTKIMPGKSK